MTKKVVPMMLLAQFAAVALAGGGGYFVGIRQTKPGVTAKDGARSFGVGPSDERQQRFGQGAGGFRGGAPGGGFTSGEIMAKDDKSITVKLRDGGSRLVFLSETTEVGKFVNGAVADLDVGKNVTVVGKTNQDGSVTAQSVQLRPDGIAPTFQGQPPAAAKR